MRRKARGNGQLRMSSHCRLTKLLFFTLVVILIDQGSILAAERIRFAYPAKSLNYLPVTLGRDKGVFQGEGIDLQMILVASTIQVAALTTGDLGNESLTDCGAAAIEHAVFRLAHSLGAAGT